MLDETLLNKLPPAVRVEKNAALSDYTTFQLGGLCPALIDCPDADSLAATAKRLAAEDIPFMVIGQGSNLLISDSGLECVVLRYCAGTVPAIKIDGCRMTVPGHMLLDDLARVSIKKGLGDVSFCSGIPGTVGGAIAGNAGAFGRQIGDVVKTVRLMNADGSVEEVAQDELDFQYRSSALKKSGAIVLDTILNLEVCDVQTMQAERERILALRREKHPDWKTAPCAGSVFRNIEPTSAAERRQAAGWFLEEAGAKAFRVGGAHLFDRHANIIIAGPEATAMDVFQLTEKMISAVREKFDFDLEREIKLLGNF